MIYSQLVSILIYVLSYYVGGFVGGMAKEEHEDAKKYLSWIAKLYYVLPLLGAIAIYMNNLNIVVIPIVLFLIAGIYDYGNAKTMKRIANYKIGYYTWNAFYYLVFTVVLLAALQVVF